MVNRLFRMFKFTSTVAQIMHKPPSSCKKAFLRVTLTLCRIVFLDQYQSSHACLLITCFHYRSTRLYYLSVTDQSPTQCAHSQETHQRHKELQVHCLGIVSISKVWFAAHWTVEVLHTLLIYDHSEVAFKTVFAEYVCAPWHVHHLEKQNSNCVNLVPGHFLILHARKSLGTRLQVQWEGTVRANSPREQGTGLHRWDKV